MNLALHQRRLRGGKKLYLIFISLNGAYDKLRCRLIGILARGRTFPVPAGLPWPGSPGGGRGMHRSDLRGQAQLCLGLMAFVAMVHPMVADAALPVAPRQESEPWKPPPGAAIQLTRVQLGAWRTAIEAAKGWDRIQRRAAGTMDGLSPRVVPATLPGRGTFYRLWVGPVLKASAMRLCAQLQSKHIDCIPAPADVPGTAPSPGTAGGVFQAKENP